MVNTQIAFNPDDLNQLLPTYYKELFPYKLMFKWLSYGNKDKTYFRHREFCFTLEGDVYLRYKSFNDALEMERTITGERDNKPLLPHKIDIGAVYNMKPQEKNPSSFEAWEREFVFDIDLTDYDDVRTCCKGGDICPKCWQFMAIAVKVLDRALEEDFGFSHCLWVYSGRRGVHCWVCDDLARKLSQSARTAIVEYLTLVVGGEQQHKKVALSAGANDELHPLVEKSLAIIRPMFVSLCKSQEWLRDDEHRRLMVQLFPQKLQKGVEELFETGVSEEQCWSVLTKRMNDLEADEKFALDEVILQYSYPRLDANVSKGINHLLKSPFCVHPKTGKVSVPFDPSNVDHFNPDDAPRVDILFGEVKTITKNEAVEIDSSNGNRKRLYYKHSSLREAIEVFELFLKRLDESGHS